MGTIGKVSGSTTSPSVGRSGTAAPAGSAHAASAAASLAAADALSVSGAAQFVASVQAEVARIPDIRKAKVEALKAKLDSDDYHPDGEAVAEGLVRENMPPRQDP